MADYGGYLQVAGGLAQVIGSIQEGIAAQRQADYNARIARYNAEVSKVAAEAEAQQLDFNRTVALQDAELATQAAQFQRQQYETNVGRIQGQNLANIGASGVLLRGSPMQVLVDNAYQAEMQAQLITYRGELASLAETRRADLFGYQAELKRFQGEQGITSGEQQASILAARGSDAFSGSVLRAGGIAADTAGKFARAKSSAAPTLPVT